MTNTVLSQYRAGVNKILTNVALGRRVTGGECLKVLFPEVNVNTESGNYTVGGFESFYPYDTRRAVRGDSNYADAVLSNESFDANEEQIAFKIDTREINEAADIMNLERQRTQMAADIINNTYAVDACTVATTAGSYATGFTGAPSTKWDASGGKPVNDVLKQIATIVAAGEGVPNRMVFGSLAWPAFQTNAEVKSMWNQAGQTGPVTIGQISSLLPQIELAAVETTVGRTPAGANSLQFDADGAILARVANMLPGDTMTGTYGAFFISRGLTIRTWDENGGAIRVVSAEKIGDVKLCMLDSSSDTRLAYYFTATDS